MTISHNKRFLRHEIALLCEKEEIPICQIQIVYTGVFFNALIRLTTTGFILPFSNPTSIHLLKKITHSLSFGVPSPTGGNDNPAFFFPLYIGAAVICQFRLEPLVMYLILPTATAKFTDHNLGITFVVHQCHYYPRFYT